ncbi:MAG: MG2 domain-containing protein, partial [Bacteroidota bacterium]
YTSGIVSKAAPIKVRFTQAVIEEDQVGTTAKNILDIRPSVAGEATWQDAQTLVFEANEYLASDQAYTADIDLKKLFSNLPKDLSTFRFNFQTRQQGIKVRVNQVSAVSNDDLRSQQILGEIRTADIVNTAELEKALNAKQGSKTLPVQLNNTGDLTHSFVVNEIERGESASKVEIEWNGKAIGAENTGKEEIEIPALGDFSVTDARLMQDNGQFIMLNFSDPLQKKQDVSGLIGISNYNGGLRYVIDGNQLRVYTNGRLTGDRRVSVAVGIKNINGKRMPKASIWTLSFEDVKPAVRLVGKGVILPDSDGMVFPFEAVSLNAVEVEILKVFNNNILQFLQTNELDGSYNLNRVGRIVYQGKVDLQQLGSAGISGSWTRYALDLDKFVEDDPQAIYQVRIGFRPEYSTFFCGETEEETTEDLTTTLEGEEEEIESFWDNYYGFGEYYSGYWNDRDNPCKAAYYYRENFVRRNVLASNLGIIAKEGKDKSMLVSVSDLRSAQPLSGVTIEFYDYQQQLLNSASTDGAGTAIVQLERAPFAVIAKNGQDRGYLKLQDGNALSLSRFNVSGAVTQKGLKGYLYGERGVWRPGDSIYLNFVIEDAIGKLPQNYPITFELRDARGQLQEKRTTSESIQNIYPLHTATTPDAPTGNWTATVKAGGATFSKTLKVETVKPNRLKVNLDFGKEKLSPDDEPARAELNVKWLHGAPAQNLAAKVELSVNTINTKFEEFSEYEFDDPARRLESEPRTVFDGQLNAEGKAVFTTQILANNSQAPGRVRANFKSRAFENGGDFSTRNTSLTYDPYQTYAGTFIPKNKYGEKRLDMNKNQTLDFAVVNKDGKAVSNQNISVGLYRVEWRWWWDRSNDNVTRYNSSSHYDAIQTENLTTNSRGEANWNMKVTDWGRYLVRVCDTKSGHCSGDFFYAGYPWYDDDGQNRQAAAMLAFSTDKDKYNVGETVQL